MENFIDTFTINRFLKSKAFILLSAFIFVAIPYLYLAVILPIASDSGVFMYSGKIIADGGMPYLNAWDHKGPIIYLFNYFGILLFNHIRGIILLEGILLFLSVTISAIIWKKVTNTTTSFFLLLAFVSTYFLTFEMGNLSETWFVPFSLTTYSLTASYLIKKDTLGRYGLSIVSIAFGLSIAIASLTRLNNGLGVSCLAVIFLFLNKENFFKPFLIMVVSCLTIVLPTLFWLYYNDAFPAFLEQYIAYNVFYVNEYSISLVERVRNVKNLLVTLLLSPLWLMSMFCVIYSYISKQNQLSVKDVQTDRIKSIFLFIFLLNLQVN